MLLFNIVPLLGLGQMQVYTQTFLGCKGCAGWFINGSSK